MHMIFVFANAFKMEATCVLQNYFTRKVVIYSKKKIFNMNGPEN